MFIFHNCHWNIIIVLLVELEQLWAEALKIGKKRGISLFQAMSQEKQLYLSLIFTSGGSKISYVVSSLRNGKAQVTFLLELTIELRSRIPIYYITRKLRLDKCRGNYLQMILPSSFQKITALFGDFCSLTNSCIY